MIPYSRVVTYLQLVGPHFGWGFYHFALICARPFLLEARGSRATKAT